MNTKRKSQMIELVLKTVALAMGVAITVLTILQQFNSGLNILTGIGLFTLALAMIIEKEPI